VAAHAPVVAPVLESAAMKIAATPTAAAAHAPVSEPALKKIGATPTAAAAPAPVITTDSAATPPVVGSPSKKNKPSGIVAVAGHAPVVSVAPSVETAPKKQANVADAVKAPDNEEWRVPRKSQKRMQVMGMSIHKMIWMRSLRRRKTWISAQISGQKRIKGPSMKVFMMR